MLARTVKEPTKIDQPRTIEVKHLNGDATDIRLSDDQVIRIVPGEMVIPLVESWIEKWSRVTTFGIDSRDARRLVTVAALAAQRQIFDNGRTAVDARNNVIY